MPDRAQPELVATVSTAEGPLVPPRGEMEAAGLHVEPIPRVSPASPEVLRRRVSERAGPAILSGLCASWPALHEWTPERLRERAGTAVVTALFDLPAAGVLYPRDQRSYERTITLAELVDAMLAARPAAPCYLANQRVEEVFDPSCYDFSHLTGEDDGETRVWIGSDGTRSMLHSDLKDNLFCQIWGRKSVTLLPWESTRAAYPFPDNLVNSQVDLADPDVRRFPRLRDATFYSSVVGPGDVVFIPRGCWHDIRALSPSVSVNHWFGASQTFGEYMRVLARLGPEHWRQTLRDLLLHGVLGRPDRTRFFFSPPSTGRRLYHALRGRGFSHENDPTDPGS